MDYNKIKEEFLKLTSEEKVLVEEINADIKEMKLHFEKLRGEFVKTVEEETAKRKEERAPREAALDALRGKIVVVSKQLEDYRYNCPHTLNGVWAITLGDTEMYVPVYSAAPPLFEEETPCTLRVARCSVCGKEWM